ncbi:CoA transferase subunit A [Thermodesulfobacteriota bacterium]
MPELKEKLCSLSGAAGLIRDGARVHVGGFSMNDRPMAFVSELIRRGVKDLTLICHTGSIEADILVGAGCVKRIEFAYVGLEEFGLAPNFRRAAENGEIELVEYSEHAAFQRFTCNTRGESFFAMHEMLGTDLPKVNPDIKEFISPFDGSKCHLVPAADPEWVIIHAPMGDKYGNILYLDKYGMDNHDIVASRACDNIIVTVEKLITRERVFALARLNLIPRFRTTAIVEVPYGGHPSSCLGIYDYDKDHMKMYAQMAGDPNEFRRYLDKYVYGVKSQIDYLELVGFKNLMKIREVGGGLQ